MDADDNTARRKIAEALYEKHRSNAQGMLGGKSAAMGEKYMFNDDGSLWNPKASSAAYDSRQNNREQEIEDLRVRESQSRAKR